VRRRVGLPQASPPSSPFFFPTQVTPTCPPGIVALSLDPGVVVFSRLRPPRGKSPFAPVFRRALFLGCPHRPPSPPFPEQHGPPADFCRSFAQLSDQSILQTVRFFSPLDKCDFTTEPYCFVSPFLPQEVFSVRLPAQSPPITRDPTTPGI